MGDGVDNMPPSHPVFLLDEERGVETDGTQPLDRSEVQKHVSPSAGTMIEYPAQLEDLRILTPYRVELETRLGDSAYVLQFQEFTLDSVPNEWKRKDPPLLWKINFDLDYPVTGFVTDQELGTFYFPGEMMAHAFLAAILGENTAPTFEETLKHRDQLDRLLR